MQKEKIGFYMVAFVGAALAITSVLKIIGAEELAKTFANPSAPYILAALELLIAAAIFIPTTRMLGIILAASYLGGAIAISWLLEGEMPIPGMALNTILYVGAALYRPFLQRNGTASA